MALNLKTELLMKLGEFGLVPDEIDRLVFVSDQGANVQISQSQADPVPLRILKHRCMGLLAERIVLGHHEKLAVLLWPKFK